MLKNSSELCTAVFMGYPVGGKNLEVYFSSKFWWCNLELDWMVLVIQV